MEHYNATAYGRSTHRVLLARGEVARISRRQRTPNRAPIFPPDDHARYLAFRRILTLPILLKVIADRARSSQTAFTAVESVADPTPRSVTVVFADPSGAVASPAGALKVFGLSRGAGIWRLGARHTRGVSSVLLSKDGMGSAAESTFRDGARAFL